MANEPAAHSSRKRFVPLENNPEVMTRLVHQLGLSRQLAFHDVFSIDEPELLAFVPRPASALLLVFPVSASYERFRNEEDSKSAVYAGKGPDEPVIWYKQTIGNACGLIGLLHAASNGNARQNIENPSGLRTLLNQAIPLSPDARADLLYESPALESAHASAAAQGDTTAPSADADIDLHYVCFVVVQNGESKTLWELDGRRTGPIKRGDLHADDDALSDRALDIGVRRFLKREQEAGDKEMRFSLVALGPALD